MHIVIFLIGFIVSTDKLERILTGFWISLAQIELKHTVEVLHEEQERIVKIETIKKSLEVEVKVSVF